MYVGRLNLSEGSGKSERKGRRKARNIRGKASTPVGMDALGLLSSGICSKDTLNVFMHKLHHITNVKSVLVIMS